MKLLINYIDINDSDNNGNTSLIYAARYKNNVRIVERIIQVGANESIQNIEGEMYTHFIFKPKHRRIGFIKACLEQEPKNQNAKQTSVKRISSTGFKKSY